MSHASFALLMAVGVAVELAGCRSRDEAPPNPTSRSVDDGAAAPRAGITIEVAAADGPVVPLVRQALEDAMGEKRTLVVYVGAAWCEPCQTFHRAAERGELAARFPALTLLEFDLDRDRDRLATGGYVSTYIPLFALPRTDGAASGRQIEGAIKGDGAVEFIAARLQALLAH